MAWIQPMARARRTACSVGPRVLPVARLLPACDGGRAATDPPRRAHLRLGRAAPLWSRGSTGVRIGLCALVRNTPAARSLFQSGGLMDLLCGVCDSPHKIFTTEDTEKKSLSPLRKGGQQDVRRFAAPRRIAPLVPSASSVVI